MRVEVPAVGVDRALRGVHLDRREPQAPSGRADRVERARREHRAVVVARERTREEARGREQHLDARRVARAVFVRDTIRALYNADKKFGIDPADNDSLAELVDAAEVGGLPTAVGDAGVLVQGHDPDVWADELLAVLDDPARADDLRARARRHAEGFGWSATVDRLLDVYTGAVADRAGLTDPTARQPMEVA